MSPRDIGWHRLRATSVNTTMFVALRTVLVKSRLQNDLGTAALRSRDLHATIARPGYFPSPRVHGALLPLGRTAEHPLSIAGFLALRRVTNALQFLKIVYQRGISFSRRRLGCSSKALRRENVSGLVAAMDKKPWQSQPTERRQTIAMSFEAFYFPRLRR